jgi:hypothetical protein
MPMGGVATGREAARKRTDTREENSGTAETLPISIFSPEAHVHYSIPSSLIVPGPFLSHCTKDGVFSFPPFFFNSSVGLQGFPLCL